jgi:UDP-glucose 4-epimerase
MDETHPFNNRTMYGAGKIAMEQILRAYYTSFGLPYIAFRYFNAYGPRMDMTGVYTEVMIRWLDAIESNRPPLIFGDGQQSMDFVYVRDIAHANLLALQSEVADEVFNVGTGVQTTLNELCELLLEVMGSSVRPEYREARKVNNVRSRRSSIEKAEKLLGFQAKVSLEEGLLKLVEWRRMAKRAPVLAGEPS